MAINWHDHVERIRHSDPDFTLPFAFGLGFAAIVIVGLILAGLRSL